MFTLAFFLIILSSIIFNAKDTLYLTIPAKTLGYDFV